MRNQKQNMITSYTSLYFEAKKRYIELLQIKSMKEKELEKAPPGKIHISKTKKGVQFYLRTHTEETTGKYISKADKSTIGRYLQKAYDEKITKLVNIEINSLKKFLVKSENSISKIQNAYSNNPIEVKNYIKAIDMSDEDFANKWLSIPYKGKAISDYVPYFETRRKERVRSKSELNIANALLDFGVPYKYECPLHLKNGMTIYPDFTILDVKKRRVIYWEHRGMMDDKEYAKHAVNRLKLMLQEGLFIGENVIITEETGSTPLASNEIKAVISKYLGA